MAKKEIRNNLHFISLFIKVFFFSFFEPNICCSKMQWLKLELQFGNTILVLVRTCRMEHNEHLSLNPVEIAGSETVAELDETFLQGVNIMVVTCTKDAWYLVWLKVTWEPVLVKQLQIKLQHWFQQLGGGETFYEQYPTSDGWPLYSAIPPPHQISSKFCNHIQGKICPPSEWRYSKYRYHYNLLGLGHLWIWSFRSIPGCTVTWGSSIGVGCCTIRSTIMCS